MNQILKIFTIIIINLIIFIPFFSLAVTNNTNVNLNVAGLICNNNGVCEPNLGENNGNCPLDCPLLVPTPSGGSIFISDTTPPIIQDLFISKITQNLVAIEWKTNELTFCQLFWGETQEYREGSIVEASFFLSHQTELTNLLSETDYHFKIKCQDTNKNEAETTDQKFTTLVPPDIIPPANISNFEAVSGDGQISFEWQNPADSDFKGVKIMRNEKFYSANPSEGTPVYNDKGNSFIDAGLTNGVKYYYTAFSYDYAGNYSSGAIISAIPFKIKPPFPPEEINTEEGCIGSGYYWYDDACHPESKIFPAPPEIEKITLKDFNFIQEDKKILLEDETNIKTETQKPLTIFIDYENIPEVLKTIMVTMKKDDKFFSFLLRVNKEKTAYLATLMTPQDSGIYPLTITILDYKNQTLKKIFGQLEVKSSETKPEVPPTLWYRICQNWIYILLGIILLVVIICLFRKLKKEYQKQKNII